MKPSAPNTFRNAALRMLSPPVIGAEGRHHQTRRRRSRSICGVWVRPRWWMRAAGCRWPAISPGLAEFRRFAGNLARRCRRLVAERQRPERQRAREDAADALAADRGRGCRRSRSSRGRAAIRAAARGRSRRAARARRRHGNCRRARSRCAPHSARCTPASRFERRRGIVGRHAARRARRRTSPFRDAGRRRRAAPSSGQ